MIVNEVTYGPGGYDPDKPNGNAVETVPVEVPDDLTNRATIQQQAAQALEANRLFLAIAAPTNAQSLAQIRALTRQNQRLIRLALNQFDGTD